MTTPIREWGEVPFPIHYISRCKNDIQLFSVQYKLLNDVLHTIFVVAK